MSSSTHYNRGRNRSGFTLTELLIGITIIGLLVGMLAVVGSGAIKRAQEFAVTSEITQMSQAVENFKTKYGFYPPSFEQFKRTVNTGDSAPEPIVDAEARQLLPFLNKISPNHQELSPSPIPSRASAGYSRLDDWWEFVGCNLDQSSSLQFWLSGLCHNKQFPLTGGLTPANSTLPNLYMPVGYNINAFVNGDPIPDGLIEREVFYDFDTERMIPVSILDGSDELRPTVQYETDHGKQNGDLFYVYRDKSSYLPVAQPDSSHLDPNGRTASGTAATPAPHFTDPAFPAYLTSENHRGPAYWYIQLDGTPIFANPDKFQIVSFGLDGDPGVSVTAIEDGERGLLFNLNTGVPQVQLPKSADNLCNFANGRLDKYITDRQ